MTESAAFAHWRTAATCAAVALMGFAVWILGRPGGHAGHRLLLRPSGYKIPSCPSRSEAATNFARAALSRAKTGNDPLLPQSTSFEGFLKELKASLDQHLLPDRALWWIFRDGSTIHPMCHGDWMEFGVFSGGSINHTATWRKTHCAERCPAVYGFDTFTGLPEVWEQQAGDVQFIARAFDVGGIFPPVVENAHLVKGLFSESLPPFLQLQVWRGSAKLKEVFRSYALYGYALSNPVAHTPAACTCDHTPGMLIKQSVWTGRLSGEAVPLSYLHIDCDLYAGAHDAFTLLSHKIVPGTIIVFDELINYKLYREHEVKAFWEWLQVSGAQVATIGVKGPIDGQDFGMELEVSVKEHPWWSQSAAFLVVSKPGYSASHIGL